jgi:diaminopimelate decarboxylase
VHAFASVRTTPNLTAEETQMPEPQQRDETATVDARIDANAIDRRVFPPSSRRGSSCEQLKIAEVRATELTAKHGSPLYVIDEGAARERAREVREALQREARRIGTEATVYYAGKAFLCVEVARWMDEEGLAVDVASGGELAVALAAGVDPARIGFHGNNKSEREIARAVEAGVGTIIIDSEIETERIASAARAAGRRQRVRLRVNSGVHASTHDFLATSHEDQKFGQPLDEAPRLVEAILAHESLEFVGLHCHIGSQIFATDGFRESARRLLGAYPELQRIAGAPIPELNLGGGFGIAYTSAQADEAPAVADIARELADIVAESARVRRRRAEAGVRTRALDHRPGGGDALHRRHHEVRRARRLRRGGRPRRPRPRGPALRERRRRHERQRAPRALRRRLPGAHRQPRERRRTGARASGGQALRVG